MSEKNEIEIPPVENHQDDPGMYRLPRNKPRKKQTAPS